MVNIPRREQSERRQFVNERAGAETQNDHDGRRINQYPRGIMTGGLHRRLHERGDPAVRAEFGRRLRNHDDDENGEQQTAKGFCHDGEN